MERQIQEVGLPMSARDRALRIARRALDARRHNPAAVVEVGPADACAVDEAFAGYQVERRTDRRHRSGREAGPSREAIQQISHQLQQIDQQRSELARLLRLLDAGD